MGLTRMVTKSLSNLKHLITSQGHETSSDNHSPAQRPPGEPGAPVSKATSRNLVNTHVNLEQQPEAQAPGLSEPRRVESNNKKYQSAPFGETPNQYRPSDQSEPTTHNINAPPALITDTTDTAEGRPERKTEDEKDIARILLQNKRKYICASCELDPKILDAVQSDKMASCYLCKSSAEAQKLSKIIKKNERDINSLEKIGKDRTKQIDTLREALKKKEDEARKLKERIQAQIREIGSLETDYVKMKADYQKNENEIRKLQQTESAMRRKEDDLMDEEAKTLILDILRTKVKAISRIYLKDVRWTDVLAAIDEQELIKVLGSAFSPSWYPDSWPSIRDHPNISTQTLVAALLSCTISKLYFRDPFFRCGEARDALNKIYNAAIPKSPETAIVWRAKTTSLLTGLSYDRGVTTTTAFDIVVKRIFNSITALTQIHNPLEDHEMNDLYSKIVDLVKSSINLATDWHSREFHFVVISSEWLYLMKLDVYSEEAARYATPFPASRKFESGKLYRILAVISPGFIRYLKGDGETEFNEIVWEKASVLLSESPV